MNRPWILHVASSKIDDTDVYDAGMIVPRTFFAKKTPNRLSLAIWDYAACIIAESIRLKIINAPVTIILRRL
jgi:hypothetical protein